MAVTINASTTSGFILNSDTSGELQLQTNGTTRANITPSGLSIVNYNPATSLITSGTAVASTSGTSIDFTSIPSWVKRITVMFQGVSTNADTAIQVQLGTGGSPTTTGYVSGATNVLTSINTTRGTVSVTTGFRAFVADDAADASTGSFVFTNISGNTWICNGALLVTGLNTGGCGVFGSIALAGTLNMLRVTTLNGTATFDAGSINILYE
jgi:hypothetical protein